MSLPDPEWQPEFYADVVLKRLVAWLVDTALVLVLALLALPLTLFAALFFLPVFYLVVNLFYRTVSIARWGGTPGMLLVSLRLWRLDGTRPDLGLSFLHTLGYLVSMAMVLPQVVSVALMLTSTRRQGLSDMFLGTAVLNRAARH